MSELVQQTEAQSQPRFQKLRKIIRTALISSLLFGGTGYVKYRVDYATPISQGVSIEKFLYGWYESGSPKSGLLEMIADSEFDDVTKSFIIQVANAYKDCFETSGQAGIEQAIEVGELPPVSSIDSIIKNPDTLSRVDEIHAVSFAVKARESIKKTLATNEYRSEIAEIISDSSGRQTITEAILDQAYTPVEEPAIDLAEKHAVHFEQFSFPEAVKAILALRIETWKGFSFYNSDGTTFDFDTQLPEMLQDIDKYYTQYGEDETIFLLNLSEYVEKRELNIANGKLDNNFELYHQFFTICSMHCPEIIEFGLGKISVNGDYLELYKLIAEKVLLSKDLFRTNVIDMSYFYELTNGDVSLSHILWLDAMYSPDIFGREEDFDTTDPIQIEQAFESLCQVPQTWRGFSEII